ncbi:urate hydroxylase PuuD [Bradyrhizobium sp.]|uniref:urate hydroxylase PuuD n=1 Tax=Bradyrhizobium sp. TaxID=376 RepID=UPI003C7259C8
MDITALDGVARYVHIVAVMVWIGHNWVNVISRPRYMRVLPEDPPEVFRAVFIAAARREHGVFRYASLAVVGTGVFMLWNREQLWDAVMLRGGAAVIGIGVWLGLVMTANLWFVLWPHQKKVLAFVPATVEERLRCTRITFLSSRTNTILSIPAVFFMVMGSHAGSAF